MMKLGSSATMKDVQPKILLPVMYLGAPGQHPRPLITSTTTIFAAVTRIRNFRRISTPLSRMISSSYDAGRS
ncbi:uncharacterized protein CC84DRAFT_392993 [Paraphaeosphaeria sporulosa]|uniref:Uncharacterized protein n=1 Tax=Paraphaeosphaeria sporulosa TaxID=1460663 RepID=A0A177BY30_9PLEO|nr:uncharacterized protein CC84DRAFT_392993 [Paraphaeosphaeria sporulosa]OAF99306.1 hypothetical protein CC84DRAFT_392993 [Paraphaeosphaeria sporulosa]